MTPRKLNQAELRSLIESVVAEALPGTNLSRQTSKDARLGALTLVEQMSELNEKLNAHLDDIIDNDHWDSKFGPTRSRQAVNAITDALNTIANQLA